MPKRNSIPEAGSKVLTVAFFFFCSPSQVFLHRLNQYAATKIDKNITEETVKVRVDLGLHNEDLYKYQGQLTFAPSAVHLDLIFKQ